MLSPFPFRLLALAWLILDNQAEHVESLEPITSSIAVAVASLSTAIFFGYEAVKCKTTECCTDAWINPNFTGASTFLKVTTVANKSCFVGVIYWTAGMTYPH